MDLSDDVEMVALGLGLLDGSDDEFDEPASPRHDRLVNEHSATAEAGADAERCAKSSSPTCSCRRCAVSTSFAEHDRASERASERAGKYRRFAVCPRCRHVALSRGAFRTHMLHCLADDTKLTNEQKRNRYNPKSLMKRSKDLIVLQTCGACKRYSQIDGKILAVHEVFCRASGKAPPVALPARGSFYESDRFSVPLPLACELVAIFKRHEAWRVHARLGFLWAVAEGVVTCAEPQVVRKGAPALTS